MATPISRIRATGGFDWKALGYLTSIASVFFLGLVAWPKEQPPWWYHPTLVIGMALSMLGMCFRYKSHLDEKREIRKAEAEAAREPTSGRTKRRSS